MKKVLTKEEMTLINNYIEWIQDNPNPCDSCNDVLACCGCPLSRHWHASKKEKFPTIEELLSNDDIDNFVTLSIIVTDCEKDLKEADDALKEAKKQLERCRSRFIIDEPPPQEILNAEDIRVVFNCPSCKCKYETIISMCEPYSTVSGVGFKYPCPKCKAVIATTKCYKKDKS